MSMDAPKNDKDEGQATTLADSELPHRLACPVATEQRPSPENVAETARLLSDAEQAREAAERDNLIKDQFLARLSHDLRTPLSTILTWAELLQHRQSDELLAEGLSVIERSAHALKQLLDDLLDTGPFRGS
jgi:signal transduction histidine kinase